MYCIKLTTKDIKKVLADYFNCDEKYVDLSPYINERDEGVNAWVCTNSKADVKGYDNYKLTKKEVDMIF